MLITFAMSEEPENSVETAKNDNTVVHKIQKWRIPKPDTAVIVCVSSRALFDMTEERKIWEEQGMQAYVKYMIANEDTPLKQGSALPFIRALNIVNEKLLKLDPNEKHLFDVVLMSNNHAQVGVALINSINHYDLTVERFCLTAGNSVIGYLEAYEADLYLSVDMSSVIAALSIGIASAALSAESISEETCTQLRVAFDGDAVLFSDEAEIQAKKYGLDKFFEYESERVNEPLAVGPLHKFAMILGSVKKKFHDRGVVEDCPIRTYLVTARSAASSGKRALKTLRKWGLDIDEALFLAGAPKGPILEKIRPHIFFDDQKRNIQSGRDHGVTSAHVPYGIAQTHP